MHADVISNRFDNVTYRYTGEIIISNITLSTNQVFVSFVAKRSRGATNEYRTM